jgi:hypothetical protein
LETQFEVIGNLLRAIDEAAAALPKRERSVLDDPAARVLPAFEVAAVEQEFEAEGLLIRCQSVRVGLLGE